MVKPNTVVLLVVSGSLIAGCATRAPLDVEDLPPTAAGSTSEHIIDNSDVAFYTTGEWITSSSMAGYEGQNYLAAPSGSGDSVATWNLNIIKLFDVYAKWTSHSNRGSNVKYVIHHLDANDNLVTDTVIIDQRQNGGEWFKLGTYRMSALTGRVTTSDETDGYVIADAILFREVDTVTSETDDTDGDGLPDEWELKYGLDPNDPSDASLDTDGDGLTNKDEFLLLTDPTKSDTDGDGMPDGYETDYGLDPTVDDAGGDLDGDGVSNYDEYIAGSDPNDETSMPSDIDVVLTWETPTERTDGTPLTEDEIAQYEILYQKSISSEEIVSDNESSEFVLYGSGGSESTSVSGYQGSNYFAMPAGSGELLGEWNINKLTAGVQYEIHANWTSYSNRASNAKYQYTFIDNSGSQITETVSVDQRTNGGSWQQLGTFESADSALTVSISNNADGYVIADAIKVNEPPPVQESIIIEADGENRYAISDLAPGNWEFTIRVIDTDGLKSELSTVEVKTIE